MTGSIDNEAPAAEPPRRFTDVFGRDIVARAELADALRTRMGDGLQPLSMEPPAPIEGLTPVRFSEGLDTLSVERLRSGHLPSAPVGHERDLDAARKRASDIAGRLS